MRPVQAVHPNMMSRTGYRHRAGTHEAPQPRVAVCALDAGPLAAGPAIAPWALGDPGDHLEVAAGRGLSLEAPAKLVPGASQTGVQRKKGRIIQAYTQPVPERRVICLDELGLVSAKTYPGEVWKDGPGRATFAPDYGRRGSIWVLGAFEPATGLATTLCSPRRDSASFIQLLEQVLQAYPAREWVLIMDNLGTHVSRETQAALLAWPEVQWWWLPKYACWLNLSQPWWKQLRSPALKGRRFERLNEVIEAIVQASVYWHANRYPYAWKKGT